MSDFDREAERRRLEEKYERDQEKRESTQRMSELLLKGATMTNQHCDDCGSPIFRYEGTEFCPTCQGEGEGTDAASDDPDTTAPDDAGSTASDDAGDGRTSTAAAGPESVGDVGPAADATDAADGAGETEASPRRSDVEVRTAHDAASPGDDAAPSAADDPEHTAGSGAPDAEASDRASAAAAGAGQSGPVDVRRSTAGTGAETSGDARDALLRALRAHADRAAETADPRRARDHLAAAREAAEALSALDR